MTPATPPGPADARGLTTDQAHRRLDEVGPNEPAPPRRTGALGQLLVELANPLVLVLLAAAVVSGVTGDAVSAGIIVGVVLLSLVLNFLQTYRSQQAADRLRRGV